MGSYGGNLCGKRRKSSLHWLNSEGGLKLNQPWLSRSDQQHLGRFWCSQLPLLQLTPQTSLPKPSLSQPAPEVQIDSDTTGIKQNVCIPINLRWNLAMVGYIQVTTEMVRLHPGNNGEEWCRRKPVLGTYGVKGVSSQVCKVGLRGHSALINWKLLCNYALDRLQSLRLSLQIEIND